ncbi:hypothetical protein [Nocardiopsis ansamitocini]|uniref:Uncharacterized protein n=1 Tax=Nocardiopsis ansamitocini TaxID=1670832 RepID=A0A9W6PAD6_9ACTN|nr:hypothetical protein [Nocardiopsis ansamitocini]GLU49947.1 hypothetical protein Nans01_42980 [Nocardiopsis ansamitocini]
MERRSRPGVVTAALVLLVLIAIYQLVAGGLAFLGLAIPQSRELTEQSTGISIALLAAGAGLAVVYGIASAVLAVLVGKGAPVARNATIAVQVAYVVLTVVLALLLGSVPGFMNIIAIVFALVVAGLMFSTGAKQYFGAGTGTAHTPGTVPGQRPA